MNNNNFEAVVTGNLAETPINMKRGLMSPTEVMAFEKPETLEEAEKISKFDSLWQTVSDEHWTEPKLGESISNAFRRITKKLPVEGGYLYSVATYAMTYIRGVADNSVSESIAFVPYIDNKLTNFAPKTKTTKK